MSIQPVLDRINLLIDKLNSTPIKRLVIYAMLIYPLVLMHYYRDELKLVFNDYYDDSVKISQLAKVQERCFELKVQYGTAAVSIYVYQPRTKHKNFKERIVVSASNEYIPIEQNRIIPLSSRTRILEELKRNNFSKITAKSGHHESAIVVAKDLHQIIITPIFDIETDQLIGEVMWVFKDEVNVQLERLIYEGQYFAYNIKN
jgi:hypothetical protein